MASSPSQPKLVERKCVVCGLGSHRADWQSLTNPHCDSHSEEEVAAATTKSVPGETKSKTSKNPSPPAADSK